MGRPHGTSANAQQYRQLNAFELEFHKEISEIVQNTVEDSSKKVKIPKLAQKLKQNYPEFTWAHIPSCSGKAKTLVAMLKKVPHFQVRASGGGTVLTSKSLEHEKVNNARKKSELREMYVTLHQIVRNEHASRGEDRVSMDVLGNVWRDSRDTPAYGQWKEGIKTDYNLGSFAQFVRSCPGIEITRSEADEDGRYRSGLVKIVEDCPNELRDLIIKRGILPNKEDARLKARRMRKRSESYGYTPSKSKSKSPTRKPKVSKRDRSRSRGKTRKPQYGDSFHL